jgi:hypothetical protein
MRPFVFHYGYDDVIPVEDNVSVRVEDTGGDGKPVFFVHGWPLDLKMFEYQFTTLRAAIAASVQILEASVCQQSHGKITTMMFLLTTFKRS